MTYNILTGGVDHDGGSRLEAIAEVVCSARPDILVLNECNELDREGRQSSFWLEHALGMRIVMAFANTGYHVALGLRADGPARLLQVHALRRGFHHGAIVAQLAVGARELTVVGTHLYPFLTGPRLREATILARYARPDDLVFLMGDMNAISPHDSPRMDITSWSAARRERNLLEGTEAIDTRVLETFENAGFVDVFHRKHPQGFHRTVPTALAEPDSAPVRIDYILASPPAASALLHAEIIRGEAAERASDHYAVVGEFEL